MARQVAPTDRILVRDDVSAREFDGEWILLDLHGGNYFGLDEVGGIIWKELGAGRSVDEVAALLATTYDAPPATITADVLTLVNELIERGLVKLDEAKKR